MDFVFYDTETTGTNTSFDQILQFAAIRTDEHLNELDRFELRCRIDDHVVPSAGALRVTGMTIERITDPALPTHYEMVCRIKDTIASWCPATFVGWNTMRFDEQILRQAFYKCLHPPYLTNTNGNERSDILKLAQCAEAFAPGVLNIPTDEQGRPTFRLDRLAPANGFRHDNAHDALADVEATIHIARLIRDRAPEAWKQLLHCASKSRVQEVLSNNPVFLLRDYFSFRLCEYALTPIGSEPGGTGAILAYNLSVAPDQLIDLDDATLAARMNRTPKLVRRIRPNAAPFVQGMSEGQHLGDLPYSVLAERAETLGGDEEFRSRLLALNAKEEAAPSEHVEERIYEGFTSWHDRVLMERFHSVPWCDRRTIVDQFEDSRYRQLGRRLVYAHCPESLDDMTRSRIARSLATRILGHGVEGPPWLTLAAADEEAAAMQEEGASEHINMISGYRAYIAGRVHEASQAIVLPKSAIWPH